MTHSQSRHFSFTVRSGSAEDSYAGLRLDHALVRRVGGLSRARLQSWVRAGCVEVAGEVVKKPGTILEEGQFVKIEPPEPAVREEDEVAWNLDPLYEDEHLICLDKPAGLVCHRNEKYGRGTLADLANERFGPLPEVQGEDRPGIVHRLDRETSGVMVLGRTKEALEELKRQFKEREVAKTYLALVHEAPRFDSDWIEEPIGTDERHPERKAVVPQGTGRDAQTFYEVRERYYGFSLVAAKPKTGRTHQIRVHMNHIGHPLVGDRLYARRGPWSIKLPEEAPLMERQALHAAELCITHPVTKERMAFSAEPPEDFVGLRDFLRAWRPEVEEESGGGIVFPGS